MDPRALLALKVSHAIPHCYFSFLFEYSSQDEIQLASLSAPYPLSNLNYRSSAKRRDCSFRKLAKAYFFSDKVVAIPKRVSALFNANCYLFLNTVRSQEKFSVEMWSVWRWENYFLLVINCQCKTLRQLLWSFAPDWCMLV